MSLAENRNACHDPWVYHRRQRDVSLKLFGNVMIERSSLVNLRYKLFKMNWALSKTKRTVTCVYLCRELLLFFVFLSFQRRRKNQNFRPTVIMVVSIKSIKLSEHHQTEHGQSPEHQVQQRVSIRK